MGDIETVRNYVAWRRNPGVTGDTIVTDALARVLAVATVPPNVLRAVQHFRALADMQLNETVVADCDAWLAAVAALRGATETGE